MNRIIHGDCLTSLSTLPNVFASLCYIDPPFNTRHVQSRERIVATADERGSRAGFGGKRYTVETIESPSYEDRFENYEEFLLPRIEKSIPKLTKNGSIFIHLDYHEVHYIKVALDKLLGRHRFVNEIIWAYDYGGRPKYRYPAKHDTILWYVLDPSNYVFNYDALDRLPYMAPGLVSAEKADRGKTPTSVWWHTIVPTNGKEKTGYPTQKPLGILNRIIKVHSNVNDHVLDFFAGSGTTGVAAGMNGRQFTLIDSNEDAINIMKLRLRKFMS